METNEVLAQHWKEIKDMKWEWNQIKKEISQIQKNIHDLYQRIDKIN